MHQITTSICLTIGCPAFLVSVWMKCCHTLESWGAMRIWGWTVVSHPHRSHHPLINPFCPAASPHPPLVSCISCSGLATLFPPLSVIFRKNSKLDHKKVPGACHRHPTSCMDSGATSTAETHAGEFRKPLDPLELESVLASSWLRSCGPGSGVSPFPDTC